MTAPRTRHAAAWLAALALAASPASLAGQAAPPPTPVVGTPAPPALRAEIERALGHAVDRFHAMDAAGVLAHVSDAYRSGPLTKAAVAAQLAALFEMHDGLQARVRIDDVVVVGERLWITSTGEVTGRLRWLGTPTQVLLWDRAAEVARRENGRWRLIGDQSPAARCQTCS